MSERQPELGDVWSIGFDPAVGREQAGLRPALVISVNKFNHGPAGLLVVLPITSHDKRQPLHVKVIPPEAGLTRIGFIKCEDVRSVSKDRLRRFHGAVSALTMGEVEARLRILLNL